MEAKKKLKIIGYLSYPVSAAGLLIATWDNPRLMIGLVLLMIGLHANLSAMIGRVVDMVLDRISETID